MYAGACGVDQVEADAARGKTHLYDKMRSSLGRLFGPLLGCSMQVAFVSFTSSPSLRRRRLFLLLRWTFHASSKRQSREDYSDLEANRRRCSKRMEKASQKDWLTAYE